MFHQYDRMRKSLANEMFKKFAKNPLAALIWILRNERIPTEIEFNAILQKISDNINVNNLSQEMGDLTMNENLDEFENIELSLKGETNSSNKRKQKNDLKPSNSTAKKSKRNDDADVSNETAEIAPF